MINCIAPTDYGNSILGATPAVVDLNMPMHAVADDAIPVTKVLSHYVVSVERNRGLVKSVAPKFYNLKPV